MNVKTPLRTMIRRLGYEICRVPRGFDPSRGHVLYRYCRPDGGFDLEEYRRIQTEGNQAKINSVWVLEENIQYLSEYLKQRVGTPRFGLCHGARRGLEQAWFRKYLDGCEVIGTEISDTAAGFPHTIQWDFHEVKDEWLGRTDFIYSNSFDHTYDPEKCLNAWMSCVRPDGVCILEHSDMHGPSATSQLDPFGAELVQMPFLTATWGRGNYAVREILPAPHKRSGLRSLNFLVIHKF
jgi:hypothetical protein